MRHLFVNGAVCTMNPACPRAEAVAEENGRIIAVGKNEEILRLRDPSCEIVDWQGAAVYPGLIDSHMHLLETAADACGIKLENVRKRSEIFTLIHDRAAVTPKGQMIEGFRFNEDLWDDKRMITADELDRIAPEHPVRLVRACGHLIVANHAAIRAAGIDERTVFPASSTADFVTGVFTEDALPMLTADRRDLGVRRCKELLLAGLKICADAGLTCVYSDDFGAAGFSMETVTRAYLELAEEGIMPVRVLEQCYMPAEDGPDRFAASGCAYMKGNSLFRFGPRKMYADGGMGARTAWLSRPYADQPETAGVPVTDRSRLTREIVRTHKMGMPVVVHAIGDAAVECVLDSIEASRKLSDVSKDFRDGVIHVQITSETTLRRIREVNADIYVQPIFLDYDLHICEARVGKTLAATSYQWKTILDSGVCISSGSDSPVNTCDAMKNIFCAVQRTDFTGYPEGGWLPDQKLTVEEAVLCHTVLAARAGNLEKDLGSVTPGKLADFSVYPEALDHMDPAEIKNLVPVMTVIGGKVRPHGSD